MRISYSWLLLTILLVACRSAQKLYEKGLYDKAFFSALDYLKKNPTNADAIKILPNAYQQAVNQYKMAIASAGSAKSNGKEKESERLAQVYNSYLSMQEMYNAYNEASPGIPSFAPVSYSQQLDSVSEAAADFHYNRGNTIMARNHTEKNAQKAYLHYKKADEYVHGYRDVLERMKEAYDLAFTDVVVRTFDQKFGRYNINGTFFENDILWNLNNLARDSYYRFYSSSDAAAQGVNASQLMDLAIYDIWFGKLFSNNYSYKVSKEVAVGKTTETVTATVFVTRRVIEARALMDCNIVKPGSNQSIYSNRFPARYTWENLTGKYTGDARALGDRDLAVIRGVFNNPPSYDQLYRELTRQIMNDFTFQMRSIYR
ncbi:MAG: hypothetical protein QM731_13355 [Chitinophagaceae bacterium]